MGDVADMGHLKSLDEKSEMAYEVHGLVNNIKIMGNRYKFQPFVQEDKYDSMVIIRTWWDDFIFP